MTFKTRPFLEMFMFIALLQGCYTVTKLDVVNGSVVFTVSNVVDPIFDVPSFVSTLI